MDEVWIPNNPETRQYVCPGCNKSVVCKRMGESSSYLIEHTDEKAKKGNDDGVAKCKYKGAIGHKLLGYQTPKENREKSRNYPWKKDLTD